MLHGVRVVAVAAILGTSVATLAQVARQAPTEPQRQVYLVRQDASECSGSDVPNVNSPLVGGNVWVTRGADGNTGVKVAMTAKPDTARQTTRFMSSHNAIRALPDTRRSKARFPATAACECVVIYRSRIGTE